MKTYAPTPQQLKVLLETDEVSDLNPYVLPLVLSASGRIDRTRLHVALRALESRHSALRLRIVKDGEGGYRQMFTQPSAGGGCAVKFLQAPKGSVVEDVITASFGGLVETMDLQHGPVWGVAVVHGPEDDYLVFAFHHLSSDVLSLITLGRDFGRAYQEGAADGARDPDIYIEYLESISSPRHEIDLPGGARWWVDRPWSTVRPLVGVRRDLIGSFGMVVHDLVDNVPDVDIGNARTVERMILLALTQAISEQGDMDAVRLDVVRHGRYGQAGCRRTRDAVGWLSRSVPHVLEIPGDEFETERCAAQLDEIKEAEPYWDEAREYLRNQSPAEDSFMGNIHAYVNFHGTLDPVGRSVGEFSYMKHQPAISYPSRSRACTPMRVLVRRSGSGLNFSWRYTGMFHDLDIPRGIISRTGELFRNSLGSAGGPRRPVQAVRP